MLPAFTVEASIRMFPSRWGVMKKIVTLLASKFDLKQTVPVSVIGKIVDGSVVLPPGTKLPEGAAVKVETIDPAAEGDPLVAAIQKLSKPRPHLPADYALNHGHYLRGEPKK
jgi:hypothetical protein